MHSRKNQVRDVSASQLPGCEDLVGSEKPEVPQRDSRCVLASLVYALGKGDGPMCHLVFPGMTMDYYLCPAVRTYIFHILVFPLNMSNMVSVSSYLGIYVISQPE